MNRDFVLRRGLGETFRGVAHARRLAPIRRGALFVASSLLLLATHRTIEKRGLAATTDRFMRARPRPSSGARATQREILDEIDAAVSTACEWLPVPMSCLPRSITAYVLAEALGASPTHHIGVRARPYFGHAWTQVDGRTIGDALEDAERASLRVLKRFPRGESA